jgi:two-component system nitrate/nitrite response regulator NarL
MTIRVMVASEVRLYREALQRVLQNAFGMVLVGVAVSTEDVVEQARKLAPTVVVVDMAMADSLALTQHVTRAPMTGGVMVFGMPEVAVDVVACLPSGILGFVTQDGTAAVLLDAIRAVGRLDAYGSTRIAPVAAVSTGSAMSNDCIDDLTAREREILKLMQQGVSNKTISRQLGIELSTVKNHVHSILAKLGVHRRGEAISLLYQYESAEHGWGVASRTRTEVDDIDDDELPPEAALA